MFEEIEHSLLFHFGDVDLVDYQGTQLIDLCYIASGMRIVPDNVPSCGLAPSPG